MRIGIDFDNTIVCYDALFHGLAAEAGLIPECLAADKRSVRDYLRQHGQEDAWTALQGAAYGQQIRRAAPFPGVKTALRRLRQSGVDAWIISHKTRWPYAGPRCDLHQAARDWLRLCGFHDPDEVGLEADRVFLEETRQAKLRRIASLGCSHFIDDLPELLLSPDFPPGVQRILFDPTGRGVAASGLVRLDGWERLPEILQVTG